MDKWINVEEDCDVCYGTGVVDVDAYDDNGNLIQGADNCPNPDCMDGKVNQEYVRAPFPKEVKQDG